MTRNQNRLGIDSSLSEELPGYVESTSKGLDFIAPTEIVELPSGGRFYPKDHPLHGMEEIEIRLMTTKDQDILNNKSLIKKGKALERTIQGLLVDKSIRLNDLLVGDKNAVILKARISGISEIYNVNITCPNCGTSAEYEYDLNEIKTFTGAEDAVVSEEGTFEVQLPISKVTVKVRLLNGHDENFLQEQEMKKKKHKLPETPLTDQFKRLIVSVDGETDVEVIGKFAENMLNRDAIALSRRYNEVAPNIDMKQPFECKSCEFSDLVSVPLTAEFFWPKR